MNTAPDTFVILDQASGYLQLDILEAARVKYDHRAIVAGTIVERSVKLDDTIQWDKIIPYDRSTTKRRIVTWVKATWQMFWITLRKYRGAHLLAITNPPLSPFVPWLLGCRYDILVYDVYPDALVLYKYVKPNHPVVKIWRWLNRKAFAKARKVYTLSESMKQLVAQYVDPQKIEIVPIWTDNTFIQPVAKSDNLFLVDKPYRDKFIITYAGNMGQTHPVEVLLEVAKMLDPEQFHVVLAGGGHKYKRIEKQLEEAPIANVSLYPWQPVELLPHVLSAAHISVVTLDEDAASLSVPSKTFNAFSVGNPVLAIASADSELKRLLEQYDCGATFSSDQLANMVAYITSLQQDKSRYQQLTKNSLQASTAFTSDNAKDLVA